MSVPCTALLGVGIAFLAGCGSGEHELEGSLTQLVDLKYRKVDVVKNPEDLAIRFLAPQGAGDNVVLRLSVDLAETSIDAGETFNLASTTPDGVQRGVISRSVLDDPLTTFPPLQRGQLTFSGPLNPGGSVSGDFRVTFENGVHVASGRTVFGTFEATVQ
jgi:hypothetical protein